VAFCPTGAFQLASGVRVLGKSVALCPLARSLTLIDQTGREVGMTPVVEAQVR
jgi:hypothetical protein